MDPDYDRVAAETLPSLQEVFPKKLTIGVLIIDKKNTFTQSFPKINIIILILTVILLASCGGSQDIPISPPPARGVDHYFTRGRGYAHAARPHHPRGSDAYGMYPKTSTQHLLEEEASFAKFRRTLLFYRS